MTDKPYLPEPVEFTPEVMEQIRKETDEIIKSYKKPPLGGYNTNEEVRRLRILVRSLLTRIEDLEAKVDGLSKNTQRTI